MGILDGVGIQFQESMSGYLGIGMSDPREGALFGEHQGTEIRFDVQITVSDLGRFLNISHHEAELSEVRCRDHRAGSVRA